MFTSKISAFKSVFSLFSLCVQPVFALRSLTACNDFSYNTKYVLISGSILAHLEEQKVKQSLSYNHLLTYSFYGGTYLSIYSALIKYLIRTFCIRLECHLGHYDILFHARASYSISGRPFRYQNTRFHIATSCWICFTLGRPVPR